MVLTVNVSISTFPYLQNMMPDLNVSSSIAVQKLFSVLVFIFPIQMTSTSTHTVQLYNCYDMRPVLLRDY